MAQPVPLMYASQTVDVVPTFAFCLFPDDAFENYWLIPRRSTLQDSAWETPFYDSGELHDYLGHLVIAANLDKCWSPSTPETAHWLLRRGSRK